MQDFFHPQYHSGCSAFVQLPFMCSRSDYWISAPVVNGWCAIFADSQKMQPGETVAKLWGVVGIMIVNAMFIPCLYHVYTMFIPCLYHVIQLYRMMKILIDIDQQGGSKNERTGLHPIDLFGFLSTRSWLLSPHEMESIGFGLKRGV